MVLFITLYKVVLESVDEIIKCMRLFPKMKAIDQYFPEEHAVFFCYIQGGSNF